MGGRKSGVLAGIRACLSRFREAIVIRFLRPDLGRRGERLAARYLRRQGFRIIARNWRARSGEIDLIALVDDTLVFVEVKSRTLSERGDALERIDFQKARRIRRAALAFRRRARGGYARCRIDGVVVEFAPGRRGRPVPAGVRWYPGLHSMDELD